MKILKIVLILFFITLTFPSTVIKAEKATVKEIITNNIEKSTDDFYKNTSRDLQHYYQSQFDFYINMSKNLISVKNINNVLSNLYTSALNEITRVTNNILKYINFITPSDYK